MFTYLVTPSGSKIAHAPRDLADYAGVDAPRAESVLRSLAGQRIVRPVDGPGGDGARYEIFHDVLGDTVLAWRSAYVTERRFAEERAVARRKQRQLFAIVAATLVALAVVGSVAVFAWAQRAEARDSARLAQARELQARASVVLADDPQESLALAVRSAVTAPTAGVEEVLRRALLTDQSRRTWRLGDAVSLVRYSPDGRRIAAVSGDRLVFLPTAGAPQRVVRLDGRPLAAAFDREGWLVVVTAAGVERIDPVTGERGRSFTASERLVAAWVGNEASRAVVATEVEAFVVRPGTRGARRVRSLARPVQVALTSDDRTLAVVGRAASGRVTTRLYEVRTGRPVAHLDQRGVRDVEFSPDGALLATASADGSTMLWRSSSGRLVASLDDEEGSINDVAFDPAGALLATASSDGVVRVWDVAKHDRLWYFLAHGAAARRVGSPPSPMHPRG